MKHLAKNKIISLKQWVAKRKAKDQQKAISQAPPLNYQEQEIDDDIILTGMLIW